MNRQLRLILAIVGVSLLLLVTVFSAFANGPAWQKNGDAGSMLTGSDAPMAAKTPTPAPKSTPASGGKGCTDMKASDPALWFAVDADGNWDTSETVTEYPAGTMALAAGFEYACVPKNTTIVSVWYVGGFDTEPAFTDKEPLKASSKGDIYSYSIEYAQGTEPLPEGTYGVQFYNNKKLLTSGEITVGGNGPIVDGGDVTVQGTILDGKTNKPIKGAIFVILKSGITLKEWADKEFPEDDVYTYGQTDAKGKFECEAKVQRNVTYSVMAGATKYKPTGGDDFIVDDTQEDPVDLTIKLYK